MVQIGESRPLHGFMMLSGENQKLNQSKKNGYTP